MFRRYDITSKDDQLEALRKVADYTRARQEQVDGQDKRTKRGQMRGSGR